MDNLTRQTKQEIHVLSRFIGTRSARWITAILLLPVCFFLAPSAEYFLALTVLLPRILKLLLKKTDSGAASAPVLSQTLQKYHYSDIKYQAEKRTTPLLILFLCLWQCLLAPAGLHPILRIYPGIVIMVNIISRLTVTLLFRLYVHYQFITLNTLDDI